MKPLFAELGSSESDMIFLVLSVLALIASSLALVVWGISLARRRRTRTQGFGVLALGILLSVACGFVPNIRYRLVYDRPPLKGDYPFGIINGMNSKDVRSKLGDPNVIKQEFDSVHWIYWRDVMESGSFDVRLDQTGRVVGTSEE
jgi:hypothetical protein